MFKSSKAPAKFFSISSTVGSSPGKFNLKKYNSWKCIVVLLLFIKSILMIFYGSNLLTFILTNIGNVDGCRIVKGLWLLLHFMHEEEVFIYINISYPPSDVTTELFDKSNDSTNT